MNSSNNDLRPKSPIDLKKCVVGDGESTPSSKLSDSDAPPKLGKKTSDSNPGGDKENGKKVKPYF